jgi:DNA-binding XRE family transcriptional regulator
MILLEYTREQMATILRVQPNTISKTKNKIAKSLNTTSSQLRDFLIDFLAI